MPSHLFLWTNKTKNVMIIKDRIGGKVVKSAKILLIVGITLTITGLITNFTFSLKQDKQEVKERMKIVNSTYEIFKKDAKEFSTTRDNLYDNVFSELYFETLNLTINNCLMELQKYEQKLDELTPIANKLKKNCKDIYFPTSDTNTKCQTYATAYEEMVNYFVNDVKQVNDNIEKYNEYNIENNTQIAPLQKYNTTKKYIDFNEDKEYSGKEDF